MRCSGGQSNAVRGFSRQICMSVGLSNDCLTQVGCLIWRLGSGSHGAVARTIV